MQGRKYEELNSVTPSNSTSPSFPQQPLHNLKWWSHFSNIWSWDHNVEFKLISNHNIWRGDSSGEVKAACLSARRLPSCRSLAVNPPVCAVLVALNSEWVLSNFKVNIHHFCLTAVSYGIRMKAKIKSNTCWKFAQGHSWPSKAVVQKPPTGWVCILSF